MCTAHHIVSKDLPEGGNNGGGPGPSAALMSLECSSSPCKRRGASPLSPPPGSQLFRSLELVPLPGAPLVLAPGKDSLGSPTARGSGQEACLLSSGKRECCCLGLNFSCWAAWRRALPWHQVLLRRTELGSSARSLNSCLIDRTSLLASTTTSSFLWEPTCPSCQVARSPVCSGGTWSCPFTSAHRLGISM